MDKKEIKIKIGGYPYSIILGIVIAFILTVIFYQPVLSQEIDVEFDFRQEMRWICDTEENLRKLVDSRNDYDTLTDWQDYVFPMLVVKSHCELLPIGYAMFIRIVDFNIGTIKVSGSLLRWIDSVDDYRIIEIGPVDTTPILHNSSLGSVFTVMKISLRGPN